MTTSSSSETYDSLTIETGLLFDLLPGGYAQQVWVEEGGVLRIYSGATVDDATLLNGHESVTPIEGGDCIVVGGGELWLEEGAGFTSITISQGASVNGIVTRNDRTLQDSHVTLYDGVVLGSAELYAGQRADNPVVYSGGHLVVHKNAALTSGIVFSGGGILVHEGADVYLNGLQSGCSVNGFMLQNNSYEIYDFRNGLKLSYYYVVNDEAVLYNGQYVAGASIESGAEAVIHSGGTLSSASVSSGGIMRISSGAIVYSAYIAGGDSTVTPHPLYSYPLNIGGGELWLEEGAGFTSIGLICGASVNGIIDRTYQTLESSRVVLSSGAVLGAAELYRGQSAVYTEVYSGGGFLVHEGANLNSTTLYSGGSVNGFALNNNYGSYTSMQFDGMNLSGDYVVNDSAVLYSGQHVDSASIESGASATIHSGGSLSSASVLAGGTMRVASGAGVTSTGLEGGHDYVTVTTFGGESSIVVGGGELWLEEGAAFTSITVSQGASVNGIVTRNDRTLQDSSVLLQGGVVLGSAELYNGQSATYTQICSGGALLVHEGAQLTSTYLFSGGTINGFGLDSSLSSNALVQFDGVNLSENGVGRSPYVVQNQAVLYSGQSVAGASIESGGEAVIHSGGILWSASVLDGGALRVASGATVTTADLATGSDYVTAVALSDMWNVESDSIVVGGGELWLEEGAAFTSITISQGASVNGIVTRNDRILQDSYVNLYYGVVLGSAELYNGQSATYTQICSGGALLVREGAQLTSTTLFSGGTINGFGLDSNLSSNALVQFDGVNLSENWAGLRYVVQNEAALYEGQSVASASILSGGEAVIHSGGILSDAWVHRSGIVRVSSGATVSNASVDGSNETVKYYNSLNYYESIYVGEAYVGGGELWLEEGTNFDSVTIYRGASINGIYVQLESQTLSSSAVAISQGVVFENASLYEGQSVDEVTIASKGTLNTIGNAKLSNVLVLAGGTLGLGNETQVSQKLTVSSGGEVLAESGAVFAGDLAEYQTEAFISGYSRISGGLELSISAAVNQTRGVYHLATEASDFASGVVISTESSAGGDLSLEDSVVILNNVGYVLTLSNSGDLDLNVVDPIVLTGDTTTIAQSATLSASTETGLDIYVSTDENTWVKYTEQITISENGTWFFKVTDSEERVGTKSITFANIDKVAPTIKNVTADTTDPTNGDVTVTAAFADDVSLASKQYKIGDGTWQDYADGVVVDENATVTFQATDTAGNTATATYEVTNIDKVAPTIKNVTADTTDPTNGDVTVTAAFADDVSLASKQYKIGDGTWQDYADGVVVDENTTVTFQATDTAGNTATATYEVTNIDKVSPTIKNVTADTTDPTNGDVTVTANFADDVSLSSKQYKIGDGTWQDYADGVVVDENATVTFQATDTAGNTATATYEVTNIDKVAPVAPAITASTTEATYDTVVLTAEFSADSAKKEYSLDGMNWMSYSTPVEFIANGTAYFRAADAVGNVSQVVSYDVTNILVRDDDQTITGGEGAEILKGGSGNDTLVVVGSETWGPFNVVRWNGKAGEENMASLAGLSRNFGNYLGGDGYDVVELTDGTLGAGVVYEDRLTPAPEGGSATARIQGIEEIRGGTGRDVIDLTSDNGGYAEDLLLKGGAGDDVLWSGSGADILVGGGGDDDLRGGAGKDIYLFGADWGKDVVVDDDGTLVFDSSLEGTISLESTDGKTIISCGDNSLELSWQESLSNLQYADVENLTQKRGDEIKGLLA